MDVLDEVGERAGVRVDHTDSEEGRAEDRDDPRDVSE